MALYDDLYEMIENKVYKVTEAITMLNNYYKHRQIEDTQYDELMEMAKTLNPNDETDEEEIKYTQLEKRVETLETDVKAIKDKMAEGGTVVPEPTEQTGTADDPITAYKGMTYEKGKYYSDPDKDNEIYLCTYNDSVSTEPSITINGMPHEYVNVYFNWYSKALEQATA